MYGLLIDCWNNVGKKNIYYVYEFYQVSQFVQLDFFIGYVMFCLVDLLFNIYFVLEYFLLLCIFDSLFIF